MFVLIQESALVRRDRESQAFLYRQERPATATA
jgi:hypothetical protein